MSQQRDWQRDDTVVIYRTPGTYPYTTEDFRRAAFDTLQALDAPIDKKKIALKPNVVSGISPDSGITIPPAFLRGVVEHLVGRGFSPSQITAGDGGGGDDDRDMFRHYKNVGFDKLAEEMGFTLVDYNNDDYVRVPINGVVFDEMPIGKTVWDPEAFFLNMPKMRTHNFGITTISLKNLQGIVVPVEERHMCTLFPRHKGDRGGNGLRGDILDTHERWAHKIIDISLARRPDLNLVDALVPRDGTGFRQGNNRPMGLVLAGINQTAVDTIGTASMGFDVSQITYLRLAGERGMGPNKVEDIRVLEVKDGKLVERGGINDLIASPPFKVYLSQTLTYQTWEPLDYASAVEPNHAGAAAEA